MYSLEEGLPPLNWFDFSFLYYVSWVLLIIMVILVVFFFFFVFLGMLLWHMEAPRLGVESELQLLAYVTATATPDPICDCSLHQSSQQCWIPNLLSETRDQTHIFRDASLVCFCWATRGTLILVIFGHWLTLLWLFGSCVFFLLIYKLHEDGDHEWLYSPS